MSPERIALIDIAPQPWKNGAGLTREIAFGGASAADFDWRLSVAEVAHDGSFSAFPGIARCITLLQGAGMRLRTRDGGIDHALTTPFVPFEFPGDAALDATLAAGACSDFNVMTRRGRFRSDVRIHRDAAALPGAEIALLWCGAGEWRIDAPGDPATAPAAAPTSAHTLAPAQALLWRTPCSPLAARPLTPGAVLLHVRLCHDRRPPAP